LEFRHYLKQASKGLSGQLKHHATAAPTLRKHFVRETPEDVESTRIVVVSRGIKADESEQQVIWLLKTLSEDGNDLFLASLPIVVDELQRFLDTDTQASAMISRYLEDIIGDLAIITECLRQVESYQPWASGFETAAAERDEDLTRGYARKTAPWGRMLDALSES
jgi:hypothetical protein